MTITLTNDFHNSSVNIRVESLPHAITPSQERRVQKALCGNRDCKCGGVRGPQHGPDGERLEVERDWVDGPFDTDAYAALVIKVRN